MSGLVSWEAQAAIHIPTTPEQQEAIRADSEKVGRATADTAWRNLQFVMQVSPWSLRFSPEERAAAALVVDALHRELDAERMKW